MRHRRLVLIALAVALLAGCGTVGSEGDPARPPEVPADAQPAVVSRHVDGDTLWVSVEEPGGLLPPADDHRVRFLQVDTPEVAGSPGGAECYGEEAAEFTAAQVPLGARVWLEPDTDPVDRYGRHLRFVWTDDGTLLNEQLVEQGYAEAVLYKPNDARIEPFRAAEAQARRAGRGRWGACPSG